MPSLLQFLPQAVSQAGLPHLYAEIASPAPAVFTDPLYVILPDWSTEIPLAIPDWPAIHGTQLPLVGDSATLIRDGRGVYRCVWWEGLMVFATQQSQAYYLATTASDVASHKAMATSPFSPKTAVPFAGVMSGQTLLDYMTPPGVPGSTFLAAGEYEFHFHALQTAGSQTVQLYAQWWEYDPNTATHVALIGQSQISKPLTGFEIEYRLFFSSPNVYTFLSRASRISVHVHAVVGGTGGANLTFYVGGEADSHVIVPASALGPATAPTYTTASKPAATTVPAGLIIFVSDGGAGAKFQGSDGSVWVNLG